MAQRIQLRRDTAANWTSVNPTLAQGECGLETDTEFLKFGDGTTAWTSLGYFVGPTRVQSVTSSATVTPNADTDDMVKITAQAAGLTLANPTGTPLEGQGMVIRIKDNGTARAISYGSEYRALGTTLPTTTVISKTLYIAMVRNLTDSKWDVVGVSQEA